ncbi:hypothetical protein EDD18DRAFT_853911 [Armillaria luteobubalina]|uniref:MYND-type domain-containing protein n=1 Tax=Armillaria luteobubalina TaxID=153913 RepID=A0AA39QCT7_9AGAR|nr:hypothetical protein EDD18DRAFT_853911 [Armillaria luteobubalina]
MRVVTKISHPNDVCQGQKNLTLRIQMVGSLTGEFDIHNRVIYLQVVHDVFKTLSADAFAFIAMRVQTRVASMRRVLGTSLNSNMKHLSAGVFLNSPVMSHPPTWPSNEFFYPIGNTPPVCLTQDLPPNIPADVLLLGCGDPRSILYTCFADLGAPRRKIDATCCDIEPAVLARNVLLLTMLADDEAGRFTCNIWEIFYHFYLDKASLDLLSDQCQKLSDLANSSEVWNQSKYGAFLRFCTHATLLELRGYWEHYLRTDVSGQGKQRLQTRFQSGINKAASEASEDSVVYNACRSAVPLLQGIGKVASEHFKSYWKSGVTCTLSVAGSPPMYVNPTFVHSSKGHIFNVHYGTDPIVSFHLAATTPAVSGDYNRSLTAKTVVAGAKLQFERWSKAFRQSLAQSSLTVRFFTGDAVHFCHALRHLSRTGHRATGIHISAWRGEKITFGEADYDITAPTAAPTAFNAIDTSNLTDHVGLLNILSATVPLLRHDHLSILQTESLIPWDKDPQNDFKERLCMPPLTFALLTGVVPVSSLSRFSSRFTMHGIASSSLTASTSRSASRQNLSWRSTDFDGIDGQKHRLSIDAQAVSDLLFKFYLKLFAVEAGRDLARNLTPANMKRASIVHYGRRNYVWLLGLIQGRVHTDWPRAMEILMVRIENDKQLTMGMNYFQDLCCEMHQQKMFTVEYLRYSDRHTSRNGVFRRWLTIPAVVCLVVQIPTSALKPLRDCGESVGTPLLQCDIFTENMHNAFCTPQFTFGDVNTTPEGIFIREDLLGQIGTSPLVMYTWIPAWLLCVNPAATVIKFCIRTTLGTAMLEYRIPSLGKDMALYSVPLLDEKHVFVVRDWPRLVGASTRLDARPRLDESDSTPAMNTVFSIRDGIPHLTAKVNINVGGSRVRVPAVTMTQISPCGVGIDTADSERRRISFPFPVDVTRASLRQIFSMVEVQVPISESSIMDNFSFDRFPKVLLRSTQWLWNLPYINLDSMPIISVANSGSLGWLDSHLAFMLSDRERRVIPRTDTLYGVKKSLMQIFLTFAGVYKPKAKIFVLRTSEEEIHTILFVTELRLDLNSQTVVADCFLLPIWSRFECPSASVMIEHILKNTAVVEINTVPSEGRTWMQLFSVITERCRKWEHTPNCEYESWSLRTTNPPAFCSCGRGKDSASSLFKDMGLDDISCFVTRAALGPLFAVPYLEDVGVAPMNTVQNSGPPDDGTSSRCAFCGTQSGHLQVCSVCKRQRYCSRACQRSDWKRHKRDCRPV